MAARGPRGGAVGPPAPPRSAVPSRARVVTAQRERLLWRARALAELAAERSEQQLLAAAVWLEVRARAHHCPGALERIAVHYLMLGEHAEVLAQPGLSQRYFARAWLLADLAERSDAAPSHLFHRADA